MIPCETDMEIISASSDMLIIDLGNNERNMKVGDLIKFRLKYMGALSLFSSDYVEKVVIENEKGLDVSQRFKDRQNRSV